MSNPDSTGPTDTLAPSRLLSQSLFSCPHCPRRVPTRQGLRAHITRLHANGSETQRAAVTAQPAQAQTAREQPGEPSTLVDRLNQARHKLKLVRIIPRVAEACAATYAAALAAFNDKPESETWSHLMELPSLMLHLPRRMDNDLSLG